MLLQLRGRLMVNVLLPVLMMVFGFGMLLLGRNCLPLNAIMLLQLRGRLMVNVLLPVLLLVFGFGMLLLGRTCLVSNTAIGLSRLRGRLMAAVFSLKLGGMRFVSGM